MRAAETAIHDEPDAPDAVKALIRAARNGDSSALGELLERFRVVLLSTAHAALGLNLQRKQAPSDLVQDVFLAASRGFSHFKGETAVEFIGWLRGILQKQAALVGRKYLRGKRDVKQEEQLGSDAQRVAAGNPSPSRTYRHQEANEALEQALSALPEHEREVFRLRRDGHTFEVIGSLLDLSAGHVQRLLRLATATLRADDRLRQLLQAES